MKCAVLVCVLLCAVLAHGIQYRPRREYSAPRPTRYYRHFGEPYEEEDQEETPFVYQASQTSPTYVKAPADLRVRHLEELPHYERYVPKRESHYGQGGSKRPQGRAVKGKLRHSHPKAPLSSASLVKPIYEEIDEPSPPARHRQVLNSIPSHQKPISSFNKYPGQKNYPKILLHNYEAESSSQDSPKYQSNYHSSSDSYKGYHSSKGHSVNSDKFTPQQVEPYYQSNPFKSFSENQPTTPIGPSSNFESSFQKENTNFPSSAQLERPNKYKATTSGSFSQPIRVPSLTSTFPSEDEHFGSYQPVSESQSGGSTGPFAEPDRPSRPRIPKANYNQNPPLRLVPHRDHPRSQPPKSSDVATSYTDFNMYNANPEVFHPQPSNYYPHSQPVRTGHEQKSESVHHNTLTRPNYQQENFQPTRPSYEQQPQNTRDTLPRPFSINYHEAPKQRETYSELLNMDTGHVQPIYKHTEQDVQSPQDSNVEPPVTPKPQGRKKSRRNRNSTRTSRKKVKAQTDDSHTKKEPKWSPPADEDSMGRPLVFDQDDQSSYTNNGWKAMTPSSRTPYSYRGSVADEVSSNYPSETQHVPDFRPSQFQAETYHTNFSPSPHYGNQSPAGYGSEPEPSSERPKGIGFNSWHPESPSNERQPSETPQSQRYGPSQSSRAPQDNYRDRESQPSGGFHGPTRQQGESKRQTYGKKESGRGATVFSSSQVVYDDGESSSGYSNSVSHGRQ